MFIFFSPEFQKKLLEKLMQVQAGITRLERRERDPIPPSSQFEQLGSMEDFEREEESLKAEDNFEALVWLANGNTL